MVVIYPESKKRFCFDTILNNYYSLYYGGLQPKDTKYGFTVITTPNLASISIVPITDELPLGAVGGAGGGGVGGALKQPGQVGTEPSIVSFNAL